MTTTTWTHHVTIQPGCHDRPRNPIVSRHRSYERALAAARKSDRLQVEDASTGEVVYRPETQNHPRHGVGRYGRPVRSS